MTAQFTLRQLGLRSRCINEGLPLGECTLQTLINFASRQSLGAPAEKTREWTKSGPSQGYLLSNSGPGRYRCGGAPGSALSWPWGVGRCRGALGSEALEMGVERRCNRRLIRLSPVRGVSRRRSVSHSREGSRAERFWEALCSFVVFNSLGSRLGSA